MMSDPITLAGCDVGPSCPSIKLAGCGQMASSCPSVFVEGQTIIVTGVDVNGDGKAEATVEISRELFDQAVAKLAEMEVSDV